MAEIFTTKGMVDEARLVKTEGRIETPTSVTHYQEWTLDGEVVKRDAQVSITKLPSFFEEPAHG